MSEIYSHSRLSTFEDCPKRFEYRYVLKIPSETDGIEAFVGRRVHEVLERLYVAARRGLVPTVARVVHRYEQLFEEHYDENRIRIVREGTPLEFYKRMGERCLTDYYRRHYPFDGELTLGIEQRVLFALDDTEDYRMQGIVDRLVRARDGTIEIHDYKTSGRVPSQEKLDEDRQLALYQLGLTQSYPGQPIRLVWHFLRQNRRHTSTRTPEQLEALRETTMGVIDKIRSAVEFKPRKSGLCDWCEYNDRCPIYPRKRRNGQDRVETPEPAQPPPLPAGQLTLFS